MNDWIQKTQCMVFDPPYGHQAITVRDVGYHPVIVRSSDEAKRVLQRSPIQHTVVSLCGRYIAEGWSFLEELRLGNEKIKIIVLSERPLNDQEFSRYQELRINGFIVENPRMLTQLRDQLNGF